MIAERRRTMELMDQPELDRNLHVAALNGLRRLNSISRSTAILWPSIAEAASGLYPAPLRVLDLACGGGDNALAISRLARRAGLPVDVCGCDISPVAISEARRSAASFQFDSGSFFQLDVLKESLPTGFHVITCSLFLHHLSQEDAVGLLRKMADATQSLVLISDLRRTWLGLGLAWAGSRLLTHSPIVRTDAVRSVAGAFVESEIASLTAQNGLDGCVITRHWPQRWLLRWRKIDHI
jgi:2-polyprenyl-3-methyl-5-hydroxy-6-metoxy-1,4-benzoquinol methylase